MEIRKYELFVRTTAVWEIPQEYMTTPSAVYAFLTTYMHMQERDRETVVVLSLNAKGEVIGCHEASIGDIVSSAVHPREIFKHAILSNAASIVVAHNHPSGDPEPSAQDIDATKRLKEAGNILGIPLLDHIVIGSSSYTSLSKENRI
ncbi:MAG: JAB domain-containing protein [Mogibacterium sp.]|nr:JAB domain-containing protein [Mogibacterium sp.]